MMKSVSFLLPSDRDKRLDSGNTAKRAVFPRPVLRQIPPITESSEYCGWLSPQNCDPILISASYANMLLNELPFAETSDLRLIQFTTDIPTFDSKGSDCSPNQLIFKATDDTSSVLNMFIVIWDKSREVSIQLTRQHFVDLMDATKVPSQYIELFAHEPGGMHSYTSHKLDENNEKQPHEFHFFFKCPRSILLNMALYLRYEFNSGKTILLAFGDYSSSEEIIRRFKEIFAYRRDYERPSSPLPDPFVLLGVIVSEFSYKMTLLRDLFDSEVKDSELVALSTPHSWIESLQLRPDEMDPRDTYVHYTGIWLKYFERSVSFQKDLICFLIDEHESFQNYQKPPRPELISGMSTTKIRRSLQWTLTLTHNRLQQVEGFLMRKQKHTESVQTLNTHQIMVDTRRDSIAMKTVAGVTMLFLPATFVATFFSMVFFRSKGSLKGSGLSVDQLWWLYPAVTIPLTLTVCLVWAVWLRLEGYGDLKKMRVKRQDLEKQSQ